MFLIRCWGKKFDSVATQKIIKIIVLLLRLRNDIFNSVATDRKLFATIAAARTFWLFAVAEKSSIIYLL